jgi:hypothetical protein
MKEPNSYAFRYEAQHNKPLGRVVSTKDVTKVMSTNFPTSLTILTTVFELVILFSFEKIPKTLSVSNKPSEIEDYILLLLT